MCLCSCSRGYKLARCHMHVDTLSVRLVFKSSSNTCSPWNTIVRWLAWRRDSWCSLYSISQLYNIDRMHIKETFSWHRCGQKLWRLQGTLLFVCLHHISLCPFGHRMDLPDETCNSDQQPIDRDTCGALYQGHLNIRSKLSANLE